MLVCVGILVVLISVLGGFAVEKGSFAILYQPAEWVIIGGAASGALLLGNPAQIVAALFKRLPDLFRKSPYTKEMYLNSLAMVYELFTFAQSKGLRGLEDEIERPESGQVLKKYVGFVSHPAHCAFVCDTLRLLMVGSKPDDLTAAMEYDLDAVRDDLDQPEAALLKFADALPGLGIVAAVLGIIVAMQSISGPREEIGVHVASALAGTFVGILLSYGFVGPIASRLNKIAAAEIQYLEFLRVSIAAFARGVSPRVAAEFGRRSIPASIRPSFDGLELRCRRTTRLRAA